MSIYLMAFVFFPFEHYSSSELSPFTCLYSSLCADDAQLYFCPWWLWWGRAFICSYISLIESISKFGPGALLMKKGWDINWGPPNELIWMSSIVYRKKNSRWFSLTQASFGVTHAVKQFGKYYLVSTTVHRCLNLQKFTASLTTHLTMKLQTMWMLAFLYWPHLKKNLISSYMTPGSF